MRWSGRAPTTRPAIGAMRSDPPSAAGGRTLSTTDVVRTGALRRQPLVTTHDAATGSAIAGENRDRCMARPFYGHRRDCKYLRRWAFEYLARVTARDPIEGCARRRQRTIIADHDQSGASHEDLLRSRPIGRADHDARARHRR